MRRDISEMVVVITGASSGIGRATALQIAGKGGTVVLASRQEEALREVAQECERRGGRTLVVKTDTTDESQVKHLAQQAIEHYGRIDAWVNDAAVSLLGRFEDAPSEDFRRVIETNFFGYVYGARAVLPYFREQNHGVMVNVASVLGKVAAPFASAYVASKHAVTGFAESLRMELQELPGIQVCTVFPSTIDTPLFQHAANYMGRAAQAMPPVYPPEEVAASIVHTIQRPKPEVYVGNTRRMVAMHRISPRLAERVTRSKVERQHFQDRSSASSHGNLFEPMANYNAVHGGWQNGHARKVAMTKGVVGLVAAVGAILLISRNPRLVLPIARAARMFAMARA